MIDAHKRLKIKSHSLPMIQAQSKSAWSSVTIVGRTICLPMLPTHASFSAALSARSRKVRLGASTLKEFSLPDSSSADFTVEHSRRRIASVGLRYSPCCLNVHKYCGVSTTQRRRHSFNSLDCLTRKPSLTMS